MSQQGKVTSYLRSKTIQKENEDKHSGHKYNKTELLKAAVNTGVLGGTWANRHLRSQCNKNKDPISEI